MYKRQVTESLQVGPFLRHSVYYQLPRLFAVGNQYNSAGNPTAVDLRKANQMLSDRDRVKCLVISGCVTDQLYSKLTTVLRRYLAVITRPISLVL